MDSLGLHLSHQLSETKGSFFCYWLNVQWLGAHGLRGNYVWYFPLVSFPIAIIIIWVLLELIRKSLINDWPSIFLAWLHGHQICSGNRHSDKTPNRKKQNWKHLIGQAPVTIYPDNWSKLSSLLKGYILQSAIIISANHQPFSVRLNKFGAFKQLSHIGTEL